MPRFAIGAAPATLPPQIHGNTLVEVLWTTGPVIIVGWILFVTLPVIFSTQAPAPTGSMLVKVIGHQFWWEFQYPDQNVITANELHLPVGRTANLQLLSDDVIHSFWVPALGGKRDAFPAHTNYIWMTPNSVGEFPGQCYQLCGYSHGNMRERAIIQTQADFDSGSRPSSSPRRRRRQDPAADGAQVFVQKGCTSCHTIQGGCGREDRPEPDPLRQPRHVRGQHLREQHADLRRWLKDPPRGKPGSIMPNLD